VILTIDTSKTQGRFVISAIRIPARGARMHGKGRVFFTAMGDRPGKLAKTYFF